MIGVDDTSEEYVVSSVNYNQLRQEDFSWQDQDRRRRQSGNASGRISKSARLKRNDEPCGRNRKPSIRLQL